MTGEYIVLALDAALREAIVFAAIGFLVGGLDDLAIDVIFAGLKIRDLISAPARRGASTTISTEGSRERHLAIFVAAWDEAAVIGAMLRTALDRLGDANYRIHVGVYPNDRATIDAVSRIAAGEPRIRMVIGTDDGPTTKAACLNTVWEAMLRGEAAGETRAAAIILHDAEDMVDAGELAVFDAQLDRYAIVQLPVIPLACDGSPLVSGHYLDEFAEAHAKTLVVRQALGAGLPLAGTGCAIRRDVIDALAANRQGQPFDAASLVEDYEMGLTVATMGARGTLARMRDSEGRLIAVRAHFPDTIKAAVRQKARWMTGISLAGWDRVGWSRLLDWREHWMRMRDRRSPLAVLVLLAAYAALLLWAASDAAHALLGTTPPTLPAWLAMLLRINGALLVWRLLLRASFTGWAYGPYQAALSLPRTFVGNVIALMAARQAFVRYLAMLRGGAVRWEKTAHTFPLSVPPDHA